MSACRIVILNYNGRELLAECLPSIVEAAAQNPVCAVTVLDNESADDSARLVKEKFPTVEFVKSGENRILFSYNPYLARITEEYVILLNNDIKVTPDFVRPLIGALEDDPKVFFAASQSKDFDGHYEGSLSKMELRFGLLWGATRFKGHESKTGKKGLTMQCGFGAFRRSYFLELGGYDDLYHPGTVEDADLCFRAWRKGWKGVYCPDSVVYHIGQASFKKAFGPSKLRRMNRRNLYLFMWKNIRDPLYLAGHLLMVPLHLLKYLAKGEMDFLSGFFDACGLLPRALKKRAASRGEASVLSDRQIFAVSKQL